MNAIALVVATTTDSPAKIVFALLVAAGVLGLGLAVVLMSGDNRGKIERRLGDLMQEPTPRATRTTRPSSPKGDQALAETALMQRMVGLTGRLADRAGLLTRTEDALEQADLPLRPPEALFFYFAGLFVVGMLGLLVLPIPMALVLALLAGVVPVIMLHRRRRSRLREFQMQLPGHAQPACRVRCGPGSRSRRVSSRWPTRRPSPRGASSSGCSPSRASAVRSRTRSRTRPSA